MLYDNIIKYCNDNDISLHALEKKAGLGNGTISGWKESSPRVDSVKRVSEVTGIPLKKLLE